MKTATLKSFLVAFCTFSFCSAFATTHIITVSDFSFAPSTLNVSLGDTIRWNWISGSHTTTSGAIPTGAAAWNSALNSTTTTFIYVPAVAGTYSYICVPHQSMGMTASFTVVGSTSVKNTTPLAVSISPNPASSVVSVQTDDPVLSVSLIDVTGRMVALPSAGNGNSYSVSHIANGIYVLYVRTDKEVFRQRLLVEK